MGKKAETSKREGMDVEISHLRKMIRAVVAKQESNLTLSEQIKLLEAISSATLSLSRTLKVKSELDQTEDSSAEVLREALMELEEEWPEFKKLVEKYYPSNRETEKK
jgi:hypothetical protein